MQNDLIERDLVHSIVGGFFEVYNYYGYGLVESVYVGALELELIERGHVVAREVTVPVGYKGKHVSRQRIDMLVDNKVIVEAKATEILPPHTKRRTINYLRITPFQVGLLLHFGPSPQFFKFVDTVKRPFALIRGPSRHPRPRKLSNSIGRDDADDAKDRG